MKCDPRDMHDYKGKSPRITKLAPPNPYLSSQWLMPTYPLFRSGSCVETIDIYEGKGCAHGQFTPYFLSR